MGLVSDVRKSVSLCPPSIGGWDIWDMGRFVRITENWFLGHLGHLFPWGQRENFFVGRPCA